MGSRSVRCQLSGLEIGGGDSAYYAILYKTNSSLLEHFEMASCVIYGTYDDYGSLIIDDSDHNIKVFNMMITAFGFDEPIKNGDTFSVNDWPKSSNPTNKEFFDSFYHQQIVDEVLETLVDDCQSVYLHSSDEMVDCVNLGDRLRIMNEDRLQYFDILVAEQKFMEYDPYGPLAFDFFNKMFNAFVELKMDKDIVGKLLELQARSRLINMAMGEISRGYIPHTNSPQEGGHRATKQMAEGILKICNAVLREN